VKDSNEAQQPPVLLSVKDLHVGFVQRKNWLRASEPFRAVDGVSFDVRAGQTLALVGESGCGKTTTGRAIVQLLRGQPRVRVKGQAWMAVPPTGAGASPGRADLFALHGGALKDARRAVQMVFQDPYASLNPRMRVGEIIEEGLRSLREDWTAEQRLQRVLQLLDQVGLRRESLSRFPHEFSGGQRQR